MNKAQKMLKTLPYYERKSKVFNELFNAEADLLHNEQVSDLDEQSQINQGRSQEPVFNTLDDIRKQLSVDTATWGLDLYESELGISSDHSKPVEARRSVIKSKMRGAGKVDAALIKMTADAYTNGEVEISFEDKIIIKMTSYHGVPDNLRDLKKVMREICPAHLDIEYRYRYKLVKEIHNVVTLSEFNAMPLTHFAPIEAIV